MRSLRLYAYPTGASRPESAVSGSSRSLRGSAVHAAPSEDQFQPVGPAEVFHLAAGTHGVKRTATDDESRPVLVLHHLHRRVVLLWGVARSEPGQNPPVDVQRVGAQTQAPVFQPVLGDDGPQALAVLRGECETGSPAAPGLRHDLRDHADKLLAKGEQQT